MTAPLSHVSSRRAARVVETLLLTVVLIAAFLPAVLLAPTAHAALNPGTLGGFEIDGNTAIDGNRDWDSSGTLTFADATGGTDDIFKQGSKESDDPYVFDTGNAPDKSNFSRVYLDSRITSASDAFLWFGFERLSGNGDAFVAFEFNQSRTADFHTRSVNDLRLNYNYTGQGQTDNVSVSVDQWNGSSWTPLPGATTRATINTSQFTNGFGDTIEPREFGEAGVDLSFLFDNPDFACANFNTVWARTRSSQSSSANVFDKAGPLGVEVDLCSEITVPKVDQDGDLLDGATFKLWRDANGNDTLDGGDTEVATAVTGQDGQPTGKVVFDGHDDGTYFVQETTPPAGYVLSGDSVHGPIELGLLDGYTVDSGTFVNTRIVYDLVIDNGGEQNLVGNDHAFVPSLTVSTDDGDTFTAADGETLALWLTGPGTITGVPGDDIAGDGRSATCTTDSLGECDAVVVTSATPGETFLHASFDGVDADTGTSPTTAEANKLWQDFRISVDEDSHNLVGFDHTFTALLEWNDGTGWAPLTDASLAADWSGAGELTGVSAGSVAGSGTSASCTTADGSGDLAAGECELTASSDTTGTGTLDVSYTATLDSGTHTFPRAGDTEAQEAASADKTWVDYAIDVTPASSVNAAGEDHTFTVSLDLDTGSGFDAAPDGETVALSWSGTGDIVAVDGSAVTATDSTTCTTSDGTCTVTVNSADAGSGSLSASYVATSAESQPLDSYDGGDEGVVAGHTFTAGGTKQWTGFDLTVGDSATNSKGTPHTFTFTLTRDQGEGPAGLGGEDLAVSWSGDGEVTAVSDGDVTGAGVTCTTSDGDDAAIDGSDGTLATGECQVTVFSAGAGTGEIDGAYQAELDSGTVTVDAHEGEADTATKVWVDYALSVGPEAENLAGLEHTFTVLLERDAGDGDGLNGYNDATVALDWTGDGAITAVNGVVLAEETTSTECVTASRADPDDGDTTRDGLCTVTVLQDAGGGGELTAGFQDTSLDSGPFSISASSTKDWTAYRIDVTPDTAENPIGTTHTFNVLLETDEGAGFGPATGETVTLELSGPGEIVGITTGTVGTGGNDGSCVTSGTGECRVTITSTETGTSTLAASYAAEVGETSGTFGDSGEKAWVSNPTIALTKVADGQTFGIGDEVGYTYEITNVGDVTLTDITLDDDVLGLLVGPGVSTPLTLEPGRSAEITTSQDVTEQLVNDLLAGGASVTEAGDGLVLLNTATTTGTAPDGAQVSAVTDEDVEVVTDPGIEVVKTADTQGADIGETVTYTYVVTNVGDVTLTGVTLDDDQLGTLLDAEDAIILAPGESTSTTATHEVVETDLPGPIVNVATTTGTPPLGSDVSDTDDEDVSVGSDPSVSVTKSAQIEPDDEGFKTVDFGTDDTSTTEDDSETVVYDITVTNTGDVTLSDLTLTDDLVHDLFTERSVSGPVDLPVSALAPGESVTVQTTHEVFREEGLSFEIVSNTATGTGTAPDGNTVSASDDDSVDVIAVEPLVIDREPEPDPGPELPRTGQETSRLLTVALLALVAGWLALRLPGRREDRPQD